MICGRSVISPTDLNPRPCIQSTSWGLSRSGQGRRSRDLFGSEPGSLIRHDQGMVCQDEPDIASRCACVTGGVIGILEQLKRISLGVLLADEFLCTSALIERLQDVVPATLIDSERIEFNSSCRNLSTTAAPSIGSPALNEDTPPGAIPTSCSGSRSNSASTLLVSCCSGDPK